LALRRDIRLRRRSDFEAVFRGGRLFNDPLLVLRTLPNNLDHNRYGFVTSKRLGGAVVRNRVRRRLQEIVRLSRAGQDTAPDLGGRDIVLSAKAAAAVAPYQELAASVRRLFAKGGLLVAEAGE
jgi:ribonuclease P protein component